MAMEILKFNLSGQTAFFRNNDVNDGDITYSYGHIHKVALMGVLGAVLGLGGHNTAYNKTKGKYIYPKFYEVLKDIKVAICPKAKYGYFERKKQNMINTCGYSINKDTKKGQILMYTEQYIENPSWDIYIDLNSIESDVAEKMKDFILHNKAVYIPYLGKTNHAAIISDMKVCEGKISNEKIVNLHSMFPFTSGIKKHVDIFADEDSIFEYREILPISYSESNCYYKSKLFVYSNRQYEVDENIKIVNADNKNLIFI